MAGQAIGCGMTAGEFVDRALNAALIKAAAAVNRIMAAAPMNEANRIEAANRLARAEEQSEVWEPAPVPEWPSLAQWEQELRDAFLGHTPKTCDVSTKPSPRRSVEEVAQPAGTGAVASASASGASAGGHPYDRATSDLLGDAVSRLEITAYLWPAADPFIKELIAELRDRAAAFAAYGD